MSKYTVNENYFSVIDTEKKAYFLGLLYADGTNYIGKRNRFELQLTEKDRELVDALKEDIEYTGPVHVIKSHIAPNKDFTKEYICKPLIRLNISSKKICEDLYNLGVFNNKTFKLQFPTEEQVPKELVWHFLRGYTDGDGYIRTTEWSIISTEKFCTETSSIINQVLGLNKKVKSRDTIFESGVHGSLNVEILLDKLYENSTMYLDRKYQKYLIVKECNNSANENTLKHRTTKRISKEDRDRILIRIQNGENVVSLAKELKIHYATLYKWNKTSKIKE
jgi:hypothetical protein